MSSVVYVAYCLDCDAQLGESEISSHDCHKEETNWDEIFPNELNWEGDYE